MKNFRLLSVMLILLFSINLTAVRTEAETVLSTLSGGNWSNPDTWQGGIVPDSTKSIQIIGLVYADTDIICQNLQISDTGTLNTYSYYNVFIRGDLFNFGVISNAFNGNSLNFVVDGHLNNQNVLFAYSCLLKGNLINNGSLGFQTSLTLTGALNHHINFSSIALFSNGTLAVSDSLDSVILDSNLNLNQNHFDFNHAHLNTNNFSITNGIIHNLIYDQNTAFSSILFDHCTLTSGSYDNCSFAYSSLHGPVTLLNNLSVGYEVLFYDITIPQDVTLKTLPEWSYHYTPATLKTYGNFTNNGSIVQTLIYETYPAYLVLETYGSFINNSSVSCSALHSYASMINNNLLNLTNYNIHHNFTNNGILNSSATYLSGLSNHHYTGSENSQFNSNLLTEGNGETLTLHSDLQLNSSFYINMNNSHIDFNTYLIKNTFVQNINESIGTLSNCTIQGCQLSGNFNLIGTNILDYNNVFTNLTIPENTILKPAGTWSAYYTPIALVTYGTITNYGQITYNNDWYNYQFVNYLAIQANGELINQNFLSTTTSSIQYSLFNHAQIEGATIAVFGDIINSGSINNSNLQAHTGLYSSGSISAGTLLFTGSQNHNISNNGTITGLAITVEQTETFTLLTDLNMNAGSINLNNCLLNGNGHNIQNAYLSNAIINNITQIIGTQINYSIVTGSTIDNCIINSSTINNTSVFSNINEIGYEVIFNNVAIPQGAVLRSVGNWSTFYTPATLTVNGDFNMAGEIQDNTGWYNSSYNCILNVTVNGSFNNTGSCNLGNTIITQDLINNGNFYSGSLSSLNIVNHSVFQTAGNVTLIQHLTNHGSILNANFSLVAGVPHNLNNEGSISASFHADSLASINLLTDFSTGNRDFYFNNCQFNANNHRIYNSILYNYSSYNFASLDSCNIWNSNISNSILNSGTIHESILNQSVVLNGIFEIDYNVIFNNFTLPQGALLKPIGNWGAYYTPVMITCNGTFTNHGQIEPNYAWYSSSYYNYFHFTFNGTFSNTGNFSITSGNYHDITNTGLFSGSETNCDNLTNQGTMYLGATNLKYHLTNSGTIENTNINLMANYSHNLSNSGQLYVQINADTLATINFLSDFSLNDQDFNFNFCQINGNNHRLYRTMTRNLISNNIASLDSCYVWDTNLTGLTLNSGSLRNCQIYPSTMLNGNFFLHYGNTFHDYTLSSSTILKPFGGWECYYTPVQINLQGAFVNNGTITSNNYWYSESYPNYFIFNSENSIRNNAVWNGTYCNLNGNQPRNIWLKNSDANVNIMGSQVILTGENYLNFINSFQGNLIVNPDAVLNLSLNYPPQIINQGTIKTKHYIYDYQTYYSSYWTSFETTETYGIETDTLFFENHNYSAPPNFPQACYSWFKLTSPSLAPLSTLNLYYDQNILNNNTPVLFSVYYSPDNGQSWSCLNTDNYQVLVDTLGSYVQIRYCPGQGIYTLSSYMGNWESAPLIFPTVNQTVLSPRPKLNFQTLPNISSYSAQVSYSMDFSQIVQEKSSSVPVFRLNQIPDGQSYYLRVRANTPWGSSKWSSTVQLITRDQLTLTLPDTIAFIEDSGLDLNVLNYLNEAIDDTLQMSVTANQSVIINQDNNFVFHFTSPANWNGLDQFHLSINDFGNQTQLTGRRRVELTEQRNDQRTQRFIAEDTAVIKVVSVNDAPSANNLSITGNCQLGHSLTAQYTFVDVDGTESNSLFQWYRNSNNTYVPITGANSSIYAPAAEDLGKRLKFSIIPRDNIGALGTMMMSDSSSIIQNYNSPTNLTAQTSISGITLNWQAPLPTRQSAQFNRQNTRAIIGYKIYKNNTLLVSLMSTQTEYTDLAVQMGQTYSYYVIAQFNNPEGTSAPSNTVSVIMPFYNATLAEMKAQAPGNQVPHVLTSECVVTYKNMTTNQYFVQDATAGIMINDSNQIMGTGYIQGDGLTNLTGYLVVHELGVAFIPTLYPGNPSSVNNTVEPLIRTIAELNNEGNPYDGRLVTILQANFTNTGAFNPLTNYTIQDPTGSYTFRTNWVNLDYNQLPIPVQPQRITGLIIHSQNGYFMTSRSVTDMSLSFPAPSQLNGSIQNNVVTLNWTASALQPTSYKIYRNDVFYQSVNGDITTFTDNALPGSGTYSYYVTAQFTEPAGESLPTNTVSLTGNNDHPDLVYITKLQNIYPNPFNPTTTICFTLDKARPVDVRVFNVKGQMIRQLVSSTLARGEHLIAWNGQDSNGRSCSSGIYYVRIISEDYQEHRKVILMK